MMSMNDNPPIRLNLNIIRSRNLSSDILSSKDSNIITESTLNLRRLYLDGLNIGILDELELFNNITHIYLQRNQLTDLNNLIYCTKLTFLCLANNNINDI